MEYEQDAPYEGLRPAPPYLWIGLTALFGVCCCFFFALSVAEAALLFGGVNLAPESVPASTKPAFGEVKFYADSGCSELLGRGSVPAVVTSTKTIYACFPYKNLKTNTPWSYTLLLDGSEIAAASKSARWTRDTSGSYALKLALETPLKPGEYELILMINEEEIQHARFKVGP